MHLASRLLPALCAAAVIATGARAAGPDVYLFDVLKRPNYRAAYNNMVRGEARLPAWIASAEALTSSTENAGEIGRVDNKAVEIYTACWAHHCNESNIVVMFENYGDVAKAVVSVGGHLRYFGDPTLDESKLMLSRLPPL